MAHVTQDLCALCAAAMAQCTENALTQLNVPANMYTVLLGFYFCFYNELQIFSHHFLTYP